MKTSIFTLFAFAAFTFSASATVLTVNNSPLGGGQYATLDSAYNDAVNGDTLYLEGTNIPYAFAACPFPYPTFDKSLTVIGIGFNPETTVNKRSILEGTDCLNSLYLGAGATGSRFYGLVIPNISNSNNGIGSGPISDLVFEDCEIENSASFSSFPVNGIVFRNCIFDGASRDIHLQSSATLSSSIVVSNCVLDGYIDGGGSILNTIFVNHCVFLYGGNEAIFRVNNSVISNSIFMNTPIIASPSNSTGNNFSFNIARVDSFPIPMNGGGNNFSGTDPMFVNVPIPQTYSSSHEYELQPASVGVNAASDGTDIGVHGGNTFFSETGEVLYTPYVREVNILNGNVQPNGTLNVQVRASRPNID